MNPGKETMGLLKQAMGQKEFGQYFEVSRLNGQGDDIYREMVERLGVSLSEGTFLAGCKPIPESEGFTYSGVGDGPLGERETIAGRVRAVMSDDPAQMLCFLIHCVGEAQSGQKTAEDALRRSEQKFSNLLGLIASSSRLSSLRKKIQEDVLYEDT